jgi:uncharacterized protein YfdQ (DUF2303 family)
MSDTANVEADGLVQEVRSLVEAYVDPKVISIAEPGTGVKSALVLAGARVQPVNPEWFDQFRDAPKRLKGMASLTSLDSFIAWTNRFSDDQSALFAIDKRERPSITSILNYNNGTTPEDKAAVKATPRFGDHRGHYVFPLSDEWQAWVAQNDKLMAMAEFAAFLEDRIIDVVDPDVSLEISADLQRYITAVTGGSGRIATPTALVGLSQGLKINEVANVAQHANLTSGEGQIIFQTRHENPETGGPVSIPSMFLITIPIFNNGPAYRLAARLRYRIKDGRPVFFYQLWRADRAFDDAFIEAVTRARDETGLPLFLGSPES